MKTNLFSFLVLVLSLLFVSCETLVNKPVKPLKKEIFSGYVQKGPFINGSSVSISELDASLDQTGRSYSTTVADNSGSFEQKQIELVSNYVQLKADGYYFNEVSGESSSGQLTLYALADISQVNSANVNVLTHLEKSRVEYLVQEKKLAFAAAKKQAQEEVLKIFNLTMPADSTSESLNLSGAGENNAILLAVSCILQGPLSTADMTQLMANISTDIKTDGTLDNASLGSALFDNARLINLSDVRQHLTAKYAELGLNTVTIPDFEKQIQNFLTKSTYKAVKLITYPVSGDNGLNILNDTVKNIPKSSNYLIYSMKAEMPKGTNLRIVIKGDPIWYVPYNNSTQIVNWTVNPYNTTTKIQEFTINESDKRNDLYLSFYTYSVYTNISIEFYENNDQTPTRIKNITVGSPLQYSYPSTGSFGTNILNNLVTKILVNQSASMKAEVSSAGALNVVIRGGGTWQINGISTNWTVEDFNAAKQWQIFTVKESGKVSDLPIVFTSPGTYKIEYHENNDFVATRVKEITIM